MNVVGAKANSHSTFDAPTLAQSRKGEEYLA